MRILSPAARKMKEDELRSVEQEREERERAEDVVDLEPLPTADGSGHEGENSNEAFNRIDSQEPLLRGGNEQIASDIIHA